MTPSMGGRQAYQLEHLPTGKYLCIIIYMDFRNELKRGRRVALSTLKKNDKLVTFWVNEELKDQAYEKCPNVSEFLRSCLERLVNSPIEKRIKKIYDDIADDVISEVEQVEDDQRLPPED